MKIEPQRFINRHTVWAMQFTTNNEDGSPTMDAIVNHLNQGRAMCLAWHNGTHIYLYKEIEHPSDSRMNDRQQTTVEVGDWIVWMGAGPVRHMTDVEFKRQYIPIPKEVVIP